MSLLGVTFTSNVKIKGTSAPTSRAFTGVWKRVDTFESMDDAGVAPSRAYE